MTPIGLYATPDDEQSLADYVQLFSGNERRVAQLARENYITLIECDWVLFDAWCETNLVAPQEKVIVITVAGMTWNLVCKQENDNVK